MKPRCLSLVAVLSAVLIGAVGNTPPASAASLTQPGSSAGETGRGHESVAQGTIAWTNRDASEVVLDNGMRLTVPPSLPNVVRTELNHGRPIKAYYEKRDGQNVVTLMYVQGVHPGSGA
jgi:hypothetical protein